MSGYKLTIESLNRRGYVTWTVFDNYGDVLVDGVAVDVVLQLLDYVERQRVGISTRTIHYFDILASKDSYAALVATAVKDYISCCDRV